MKRVMASLLIISMFSALQGAEKGDWKRYYTQIKLILREQEHYDRQSVEHKKAEAWKKGWIAAVADPAASEVRVLKYCDCESSLPIEEALPVRQMPNGQYKLVNKYADFFAAVELGSKYVPIERLD